MPKWVKTDDALPVFAAAEGFAEGSDILRESHVAAGERSLLLQAAGTNIAFTLELYLKCLLIIERGEYPEEHDSRFLFNHLNIDTQTYLRSRHTAFMTETPAMVALLVERGFNTDFDSLLDAGRNAFVDFRYCHENTNNNVFALGGLIAGARDKILDHHPNWGERWPLPC